MLALFGAAPSATFNTRREGRAPEMCSWPRPYTTLALCSVTSASRRRGRAVVIPSWGKLLRRHSRGALERGALDGGRSLWMPGGPRGLRALRWQTVGALRLSWRPGMWRKGEPLSDKAR